MSGDVFIFCLQHCKIHAKASRSIVCCWLTRNKNIKILFWGASGPRFEFWYPDFDGKPLESSWPIDFGGFSVFQRILGRTKLRPTIPCGGRHSHCVRCFLRWRADRFRVRHPEKIPGCSDCIADIFHTFVSEWRAICHTCAPLYKIYLLGLTGFDSGFRVLR